MNILITSGGTNEKIDRVRSITNHSTGQLGKVITETFLERGVPKQSNLRPTQILRLSMLLM